MTLLSSSRAGLRLRVLPRFPATVATGAGLAVEKSGATYTLSLAAHELGQEGAPDRDATYALVVDEEGVHARVLLADLPSAAQSWDDITGKPVAVTTIAALTPAADRLPYYSGAGTASLATLTAFGRSLIDDGDAGAARATLGTTATGEALLTALDAAAATAVLDEMVGDSGSGGTKGLVPAPAAGDTAAGAFLRADGTWAEPAGGGGSPSAPQGRLTLTSGTPVLVSDVAGATTVHYSPYRGRHVPLWDGSAFVMTDTGGELSQTLADTTKSPGAAGANSNYDLFVWSDGGTIRCTRGPAWSSNTSRGTGAGTTELELLNGFWVNKVAITNGPAARMGTFVGSIRTNASSQVDFKLGGLAAGGTAGEIGLSNAWNREPFAATVRDGTDTWSYTTTSWRAANNSASMSVAVLSCLPGPLVEAVFYALGYTSSSVGAVGIGYDATNAFSGMTAGIVTPSSGPSVASYRRLAEIGRHAFNAIEFGEAGVTFVGDAGLPLKLQSGLVVQGTY